MAKTVSKQDVIERRQRYSLERMKWLGWMLSWRLILSHPIIVRLRVIWWALLGRPIIYGVHFKGGIEISETPKCLIAKNIVEMKP